MIRERHAQTYSRIMDLVTIVIPCYQERDFIRACLESVIAFEKPADMTTEILVVDGMSTDGTREIIDEIARSHPTIQRIDNPNRTQSAALNLGISRARGQYLLRLDAHSLYPGDYLRKTVETARRSGADNTGGVVNTLRRGDNFQAGLVQALITHPFGVGNSGFRTGAPEGPADTVPYGCFRMSLFDRVGLFDERLIRAQDYEMNRRTIAAGGTVWRNPEIQVQYYPQPDLSSFLKKQVVAEAPYNAYMWYLAPYSFAPRHAITALFAIGVIAGLLLSPISQTVRWAFGVVMALYLILALVSATQQAIRFGDARYVVALPISFFLYHFLHGVGVLAGLIRLALGAAPVQKEKEPWPGAGRFRAMPSPISKSALA
jgi:glycosyltransferase involved in cell wall biosynthesis